MRIYTAAKLIRAQTLLDVLKTWEEHEHTSRWCHRIALGDEDPYAGEISPELARQVWIEDHQDVTKADVILVYWEPGDEFKGALVEAGMGIALGKYVIVVGDCPAYGTWQYHPQVHRVKDLTKAYLLLEELNKGDHDDSER